MAPTPPSILGVIRVVVTADDEPPNAAAWEAGELAEDCAAALARARELASAFVAEDVLAFVWIGHNGPYGPGLWKWYTAIKPPGWPDPVADERARVTREFFAHKEAAEDAARLTRAASALARKLVAPTGPRDASMDAIR